jgi:hypothetical protein
MYLHGVVSPSRPTLDQIGPTTVKSPDIDAVHGNSITHGMWCGSALIDPPQLHGRRDGGASRGYLEEHMSWEIAHSGDGVSLFIKGLALDGEELTKTSSMVVSALKETMTCSVLRTHDCPFSLLQKRQGGLDPFGLDDI